MPKDVIESPGPGSYGKKEENPKSLEMIEKERHRYMKNNPFGKSDPRFEYQKEKIDKEREGPTGDFNIHM